MYNLINQYSKEQLEEIVKNSNSITECLEKIGYNSRSGAVKKMFKKEMNNLNISIEHFTGHYKENGPKTDEEIFCENSSVSQSTVRKHFYEKQLIPYKCDVCGCGPVWLGKELVFHLDHINGINNDNRYTNLRWLCPNCDSQQDTFSGRNNKKLKKEPKKTNKKYIASNGNVDKTQKTTIDISNKINFCVNCGKKVSGNSLLCLNCAHELRRKVKNRPSKEQLLQELIDNLGNFSEIGRRYGVDGNAIRKWCKSYDIPSHSKDYKPVKKRKPKQDVIAFSVAQIDKNTNEIVATFPSITEAERITKISHINHVVNGKRKTAGGYKWEKINIAYIVKH